MKREIKFRAYHNELKEMFWFDIMNGQSSIRGGGYIPVVRIGEPLSKSRYRDNEMLIDPVNCEIMQYTGQKDKHKSEIYEGDIIKYHQHNSYALESFTAEIRYIESYACFGYLKLGLNEFGFDHVVIHPFSEHDELGVDVSPYFEVIGNIYKNPELLVSEI